jgi:hypothetical protein
LTVLVKLEGEQAIASLPEGSSLEDRFRAASKASRNHYMVMDEDTQYAGMCEAVYASATEDERERIIAELRQLKALDAMLSGVPVDFDRFEPIENPIGIAKIWRDSK